MSEPTYLRDIVDESCGISEQIKAGQAILVLDVLCALAALFMPFSVVFCFGVVYFLALFLEKKNYPLRYTSAQNLCFCLLILALKLVFRILAMIPLGIGIILGGIPYLLVRLVLLAVACMNVHFAWKKKLWRMPFVSAFADAFESNFR